MLSEKDCFLGSCKVPKTTMKNTLYLIVIQTIAPLRGNRDPPDGSKLALHQAEQKLYVAIKERELANSIGLKNASNKQMIAKGTM